MPIDRTCQMCGAAFQADQNEIDKGKAKWCGRECYAASKRKILTPLMDRIWRRVDTTGDCWIWQGCTNHSGYGQINAGGDRGAKLVHRLVYESVHGPIPAGRYICHTCDNPPCCNPAHLWCGTSRDNAMDMIAKGRHGLKGGHWSSTANHRSRRAEGRH